MIEAGILTRDAVLVERRTEAKTGDIVIAEVALYKGQRPKDTIRHVDPIIPSTHNIAYKLYDEKED